MTIGSVVITASSSNSTISRVMHKSAQATCIIPPESTAVLHITDE